MESKPLICSDCGATLPETRFETICLCRQRSSVKSEIDCIHRGRIVGIANCGCEGKPSVHWCNLLQGHCTVHGSGKPWHKIHTDDKLIRREGRLKPCMVCDRRQERAYAWKSVEGPRVAFIAGMYNKIGGTESFHQLLVPRLSNVVGFASMSGDGCLDRLGVPAFIGEEAVRDLLRNCDVAICWGVPSLSKLMPSSRPKVINCHHGGLNQSWADDNITAAMDVTDKIVCVHPGVYEQYKANGLDITLIPNAIDPRRIGKAGDEFDSMLYRAIYGVPDDMKVLVWSHRMSSEKRPDLAIQIADAMPEDWFTIIAGSGWYEPIKPKSNRVKGIGWIRNPNRLLSIADCFLSTAEVEGFGLAMGEAMASGVPVVATPEGLGGDSRLATQVSQHATIDEWVDAILSRNKGDRITQNARNIINAEFGLANHMRRWQDVIDAVTQTSRKH